MAAASDGIANKAPLPSPRNGTVAAGVRDAENLGALEISEMLDERDKEKRKEAAEERRAQAAVKKAMVVDDACSAAEPREKKLRGKQSEVKLACSVPAVPSAKVPDVASASSGTDRGIRIGNPVH